MSRQRRRLSTMLADLIYADGKQETVKKRRSSARETRPSTDSPSLAGLLPGLEPAPDEKRELADFEAIFRQMRRIGLPMAREQPTRVHVIPRSAGST